MNIIKKKYEIIKNIKIIKTKIIKIIIKRRINKKNIIKNVNSRIIKLINYKKLSHILIKIY